MAESLLKPTDISHTAMAGEMSLSHPSPPILCPEKLRHSHSSQPDFHTELLGTLQPIKITTVVMGSKICFIWTGKPLDAASPPAKILRSD